ncbi:hypothetical protein GCM10012280_52070 [Wenjunlia tyrosinilytica]|uniref:Low molecular weight antigen MTB12-like C-terminal domain-containing protein n=1 Tax=Wenjunlia tyrosinilytica TaxID=1544741 RepID=A0A918E175_9ACTN|nr:hypothetical protein GCM10012280_52070 [Wenjunlia tyrosinilytica]
MKANWEKFFSPDTPLNEKTKLLEHGNQLQLLLQGFAHDPRTREVGAQVSDVTFTSPTQADVTYSLTLKGQTAVPNATGVSVLDNGTWKVSVKTICALVSMDTGGTAVPGC